MRASLRTPKERDEVLELLLREIIARLDRIEAQRAPKAEETKLGGLVAAIREHVAERVFSARELCEFAAVSESQGLRRAILATVAALNARKVGRALRRAEGLDFDGLIVLRVGSDSDGVSWRVRVSGVSNPQTRTRVA